MKLLLALFTLPFITACALPVTQEAIDAASAQRVFGPEPIREEYMAIIQKHFQEIALDPESIILNCLAATKGWARRRITDRPSFGWIVACDVNGRNRFGGYTGTQPYLFIFSDRGISVLDSKDLEVQIQQKVGLVE